VDTNTLKVDSTNNKVGIGVTSPAEMLEIYNASSPAIQLNDGGDYQSIIRLAGNDTEIRGSSGSMEFYNGAADGDSSSLALKIDASGHVTKPLQPSFHVVVNTGGYTNATDVNPIPYDTEVFDTNNDFNNTSSGTNPRCFTAPVTGKYWFYAHQYFRMGDQESPYIRFNKNGSDHYQYGQWYVNGITELQSISQISACISLAANDYVQVKWVDNGGDIYYGSGETTFTGFLIG
jgi:hypothetical protein